MRVSVVTPYHRETPAQLRRCHDSVRAQTVPCTHVLVADGHSLPEVEAWDCVHIRGPGHRDSGDTPRVMGLASAATLGAQAILLLDADNWFEPDHVAALLQVQARTGADVVTCPRVLRRATDLAVMGVDTESDGDAFNDMNCFLVTASAFPLFRSLAFKPAGLGPVGDRVLWAACRAPENGVRLARSPRATVHYVTRVAEHYRRHGETPPEDARETVLMPDGRWVVMGHREAAELLARGARDEPA